MLKPAIEGTRNMLLACAGPKGQKIERLVITSSFAAVLDMGQGSAEGVTYTCVLFVDYNSESEALNDPPASQTRVLEPCDL